jgi:hypothetical protein
MGFVGRVGQAPKLCRARGSRAGNNCDDTLQYKLPSLTHGRNARIVNSYPYAKASYHLSIGLRAGSTRARLD